MKRSLILVVLGLVFALSVSNLYAEGSAKSKNFTVGTVSGTFGGARDIGGIAFMASMECRVSVPYWPKPWTNQTYLEVKSNGGQQYKDGPTRYSVTFGPGELKNAIPGVNVKSCAYVIALTANVDGKPYPIVVPLLGSTQDMSEESLGQILGKPELEKIISEKLNRLTISFNSRDNRLESTWAAN